MATHHALRMVGLPSQLFWDVILPKKPVLRLLEDNTAMIRCIETGRNPTMRYLHRTHHVSVAWLHERFQDVKLSLAYEVTTRMCADIYTKAFTSKDK